jgi:glycosyltransferase involved in cell wall biosynthesis
MSNIKPFFSICIPAYNRAKHLRALIDSIIAQNFESYEILICEDKSRERNLISEIINEYSVKHHGKFRYYENEINLGYDANIRSLVHKANGEYCFFMGNDDLMCAGALSHVFNLIKRHPKIGMVLKSYAWFDNTPEAINQEIRYFNEERFLKAGNEAISVCYRRAGVISGYIIRRDPAHFSATAEFDGTLYYQMHLTASVLLTENAVSTPMVLVHCRNGEPPEFGNSGSEKGKYTPGSYTPEARLNMISGAISIIKSIDIKNNINISEVVIRDYANYFYPYIKDQLNLPLLKYYKLYTGFLKMGFGKYILFHIYFLSGYMLGESRFDKLTKLIRAKLGRTPNFGIGVKNNY